MSDKRAPRGARPAPEGGAPADRPVPSAARHGLDYGWWQGPTRELDDIADLGPLARAARPLTRRIPVPALHLLAGAAAVALLVGLLAGPGSGERRGVALGLVLLALLVAPVAARPLGGRFGWLLPGLLRGIEYGLLVRLVAVVDPGAMPAAFAYLAAIGYHHYDTVYRWRHCGRGSASWVNPVGLGVEGRLLVLAVVLASTADLGPALTVIALVLGAAFVAESVTGWRTWLRTASAPVD